jgi:hypothetical protein
MFQVLVNTMMKNNKLSVKMLLKSQWSSGHRALTLEENRLWKTQGLDSITRTFQQQDINHLLREWEAVSEEMIWGLVIFQGLVHLTFNTIGKLWKKTQDSDQVKGISSSKTLFLGQETTTLLILQPKQSLLLFPWG